MLLGSPIYFANSLQYADALKFWGPAPEKINGRLAMLGFLLGALNEPKTGLPLMEQAKAAPVFVGFLTFIVVWASLIPITKGAKSEAFGAQRSPLA